MSKMSIQSSPWIFIISASIIFHEINGIDLTEEAKEEFCSVDGCEDKSTYGNLYTSGNMTFNSVKRPYPNTT